MGFTWEYMMSYNINISWSCSNFHSKLSKFHTNTDSHRMVTKKEGNFYLILWFDGNLITDVIFKRQIELNNSNESSLFYPW
jgi:hypothetical protein